MLGARVGSVSWWLVAVVGCGSAATVDTSTDGTSGTSSDAGSSSAPGGEASGSAGAASTGGDGVIDAPTYHQHVAPILEARCVGCHADEAVAHSLEGYAIASDWANALAAVLAAGTMPPFPPDDSNATPLADFRNMQQWEKDIVLDWVDAGAPEGDPDGSAEVTVDVPPPEVGDYTRYFEAMEDYQPDNANGDEYRCFLIDPEITEDWVFLQAMGIETDNWSRIHHAITYIATPDQAQVAQMRDAEDEAPGWPCYFGPEIDGVIPSGGYAPGAQTRAYAGGTTIPISAGTQFVVEVHFHDTYNMVPTTFGVTTWEFDEPVTEFPTAMGLIDLEWVIPAGDPDFSVTLEGEFVAEGQTPGENQAVEGLIYTVDMHMHLLGKTARIELVRQGGDRQTLLWVPDWTDEWQGFYALEEPVPVYAGDRIEATCNWDNSAENQPVVDGEQLTPTDKVFGLGVLDEMCTANLGMTGHP